MAPNLDTRIPSLRVAATLYAVYGCVYLSGAAIAMTPNRQQVFWGLVPWWLFFVAGALLVLVLPLLILRAVRWLIFALAIGTAGKTISLLVRLGRDLRHEDATFYHGAFAFLAGITSLALFRAWFHLRPSQGRHHTSTVRVREGPSA